MANGPVGVIEGFYGSPWSWEARREVAAWCGERGMTHYVYAPKDDPKHRHQWREPYVAEELAGFEGFAATGALQLGFAISPGLSIDPDDAGDVAALTAKVDQVVAAGAPSVVLALDDIPFGGAPQGAAHARLTTRLREHLHPSVALSLVPTEYVGVAPSPYLDELASGVPIDVPIAWTGRAVVNDVITVADAEARAAALGGRPPLVWDNYPVNDGIMADRLFLGPLRGRDAGLPAACAGYLANPMVQPLASRLPLASIAAWLRGDDPAAAWAETAADLGWLAFAHACDGVLAGELAAGDDLRAVRAYFTDAASCGAPGLEEEAGPWLEQAHLDAALAISAIDVLEGQRGVAEVLGLMLRWKASRRAEWSVFGPRCSVRPVLGQADDGTWVVERASMDDDHNAVDALVRRAIAAL